MQLGYFYDWQCDESERFVKNLARKLTILYQPCLQKVDLGIHCCQVSIVLPKTKDLWGRRWEGGGGGGGREPTLNSWHLVQQT